MEAQMMFSSEIQTNFDSLRSAVEDRRYEDIESLLQEQSILVKNLPIADPEVRDTLRQAQELTLWSLTMVKIQRTALEQSLAAVTQLKHLEGYRSCQV